MSPVRYFTSKVNRGISNGVRILIVAGASGGHIFPALSFLNALKDKHKEVDILFVLPKRSIGVKMISQVHNIKYLSISPIKLHFDFQNFIAILGFVKGSLESLVLLLEFRPDIVAGFGSINSIPLLFFAWLFRIKTLIHEQNVYPGRANRFLAKFADKIAISFQESRDYLKADKEKVVFTGNPGHEELKRIEKKEALSFLGLDNDKFTILVMGGSGGSHSININFLNAISMFSGSSQLQIIHIAGTSDYDLLEKSYKNLKVKFKLFSFLDQMQYAYSASELVICRSGATTIAELINFALPAVIIPYPYAYKHQMKNAQILEKRGAGIIIKDKELNANLLKEHIESLLNNPRKMEDMRLGYNSFPRIDANKILIEEVMSLQFS